MQTSEFLFKKNLIKPEWLEEELDQRTIWRFILGRNKQRLNILLDGFN